MNKLTNKDKQRIVQSYFRKQMEYDKMTLEELRDLFPTLKATYREACIAIVDKKLKEEKEQALKELIEKDQAKPAIDKVEDAVIIEEPKEDKHD